MLASFVFDYALHAVLVALCVFLLGITIGANPFVFLVLMAPAELLGTALGTFGCCVLHSEELASTVISLVVSLLCVLGGTFFSPDALGGPIAMISFLSPVRWFDDGFFAIACDNDLSSFWPIFLGCLVAIAVLVIGCKHFFRTEDYL
jgi:ABC-2 type transport system permease protein